MRLTLINPPSLFSIAPPLGLGYIASYLMKYGNFSQNEINIIDFVAGDNFEDIIRFKPEVIGITATTPLICDASLIGHKIKAIMPDVPIILGGHILHSFHTKP